MILNFFMRSDLFASMSIGRLFAYCVLPSSVSMIVSALYVVVDGMFVGHYLGHDSLAAANMMWPLLAAVFALAMMIGTGSSVQIARFLGQKKYLRADRTFTVGVLTALFLGVIMCIAGFIFTGPFLRFMGADEATIALSSEYVLSYLVTGPLVCLYYDAHSYMRICGLQKLSMYLDISTSLLNLLLDYIFIVELRQGIWAASFTTCLSLSLGAILSVLPFLLGKTDLHFKLGGIPWRQFRRLIYSGLPNFLEESSWSVLMLLINSLLLKTGGNVAVAANAAVMYLGSVMMMLIDGMVSSLQPAISYCNGAKLYQRVIAIEKRLLLISGILSVVICTVFELMAGKIMPMFAQTGDEAFIKAGTLCLMLLCLRYVQMWIEMALRGFLTALEVSGRAFVLSLCNTLIFPALMVLICSNQWGLFGIWLAPGLGQLLSSLLAIILVRSCYKKLNNAAVSA